ncbi:putative MFS family arabinose efflux permease [Salana multivorans]|uniref:Putative MFS family arabinose efflux permease n=1 Tax=Salana multivorans TaxID=120377 RepID=A0A3N2D194_9MICO|nr:putative MFS family arabinose efflux permease [Salana multivorans]
MCGWDQPSGAHGVPTTLDSVSGERPPGAATATTPPREILRHPAFAYFWGATTIRAFGGAIAGVAFQVLVVTVVNATPMQISVLSALGVVPYLFLGLIVGALMDRWRRQRTLVLTTIGRALTLAAIPVLLLLDALDFRSLAAVVLVLGVLTLFGDSASQPLLPRIVPQRSLVMANARLGQSQTVAETTGPALGGALFTLVGAPTLFAFDAVINLIAAGLQARIRVDEPKPRPRPAGRHVGHDIADGIRYTYRHPTLRPLALSVHVWFLGNSIVTTVFAVFVLRQLALPTWAYGVALAIGGAGGFVGAMIAPRVGSGLGAGRAILLGRVLVAVPWLVLALAPLTADSGVAAILGVVATAQFLYCLAMGIEDTNDISYRQSVAPDAIQGRMNSTIRTVNRVVFLFGALLAGPLMTLLGFQLTIGIGAGVFVVAALVIALSPLRDARHEGAPD